MTDLILTTPRLSLLTLVVDFHYFFLTAVPERMRRERPRPELAEELRQSLCDAASLVQHN